MSLSGRGPSIRPPAPIRRPTRRGRGRRWPIWWEVSDPSAETPSMKSELVPLNGDPPIPITRDVTVLGRREYCDVAINHHGLSKRHCVLIKTDGLLVIRDLAT